MLAGIMGAVIIALLISIILNLVLFSKGKEKELVYVDRSGVAKNPPTFLETWQNKTINFNYDGLEIKISHLPIRENLEIISKIAGCFSILKEGADVFFKTPLDKVNKKAVSARAYIILVDLIFNLSKPHIKKKWGYKKRFYKKALTDSEFTFSIAVQALEYWQYMGKLLAGASKGLSPRMKYGEDLSSEALKWGKDGERLILPRYDFTSLLSSSGQLRTSKQEKPGNEPTGANANE